jgi:hypothetical protein
MNVCEGQRSKLCIIVYIAKKYINIITINTAAGDRFPQAAQRGDEHCKPPFRVSFFSLLLIAAGDRSNRAARRGD